MVMDIGRVCVKLAGREAGERCVVVDSIDTRYVMVSGLNVKRKRCNVLHLEPTGKKVEVQKGASDEEVKQALEAAGLK